MTETADLLTHHNSKPIQDAEIEGQNDGESSRHPYHMLTGQYSSNLNVNKQQNADNTYLKCHGPAPHLSSVSSPIGTQKGLKNKKRVTFKQRKEGCIAEENGEETDRECDPTLVGFLPTEQKSTSRKTSKVNLRKSSFFPGRVEKSEVVASTEPAVQNSEVDDCEAPSHVMEVDKDDGNEHGTEMGRTKRKRGRKRVSFSLFFF